VLNETNQYDNGITVEADYYVSIFNYITNPSTQRAKQVELDDPIQVFYRFNDTDFTGGTSTRKMELDLLKFVSFGDVIRPKLKVNIFIQEKNKIFLRLENIWDRFDTDVYQPPIPPASKNYLVDVEALGRHLFEYANQFSGAVLNDINVIEVTLTGLQAVKTHNATRIQWKGDDDDKIKEPELLPDQPYSVVNLNPQDIRMFLVQYRCLYHGMPRAEREEEEGKIEMEEPSEEIRKMTFLI